MSLQAVRMILLSSLSLSKRKRKSKYWVHPILRYREEGAFISLSRSDLKQAPEVYVMSGWRWTWRRTDVTFWLKMKIGLTSIFDAALTLDFGYTTISTSADVGIGRQFNIDIRCWIYIEFWSPDVTT